MANLNDYVIPENAIVRNDDGSVNVNGSVNLFGVGIESLTELIYEGHQVIIHTVTGNFDCSNNRLKDLKGSPRKVFGNFECSNNLLENLDGAPDNVQGNFDCSNYEQEPQLGIPLSLINETILDDSKNKYPKSFIKYKIEKLVALGQMDWFVNKNKLTVLDCKTSVSNDFLCMNNKISILKEAYVTGKLICIHNYFSVYDVPKESFRAENRIYFTKDLCQPIEDINLLVKFAKLFKNRIDNKQPLLFTPELVEDNWRDKNKSKIIVVPEIDLYFSFENIDDYQGIKYNGQWYKIDQMYNKLGKYLAHGERKKLKDALINANTW